MNVLFVDMPFNLNCPAIGISLLSAHTERLGHSARIEYPSVRFRKLIGDDVHRHLADSVACTYLSGEWLFAHCLAEDRVPGPPTFPLPDGELGKKILRARDLAEPFLEECLEGIDWSDYDLVGFTTVFRQNTAALALARRVKERHAELPIVFGGANCEDEMGLQLHRSFPFVDYVCTGEGDIAFPKLLSALAAGETEPEIDGIVVRSGDESRYTSLTPERVTDLDELPYPDYDSYFAQFPTDSAVVSMETARGCWWGAKHHCVFCGLNDATMEFRRKQPRRALDELLYLLDRHGPKSVVMVDNILDMRYFRAFLPELQSRGLDLDLFYEVKANLTRDQLRQLSAAGVRSIQPGIESFSTDILALMQKGTTALQNVQLLKWCREFAIWPIWNLLYGFPREDPAEYAAMVDFVGSLHHLQPPQACGAVRLDRFSPMYVQAESFGLVNVRPYRAYELVYDLPQEEVARFAYFFDFDFDDGRDPRAYTSELREAVARWRERFGGFGLVYTDDGESLGIFDYREGRSRRLLSGPAREIYLYCEENRPKDRILRLAADLGWGTDDVEALLEELVGERLMATADGRYLGLAVRRGRERVEAAPVEIDWRGAENGRALVLTAERR